MRDETRFPSAENIFSHAVPGQCNAAQAVFGSQFSHELKAGAFGHPKSEMTRSKGWAVANARASGTLVTGSTW